MSKLILLQSEIRTTNRDKYALDLYASIFELETLNLIHFSIFLSFGIEKCRNVTGRGGQAFVCVFVVLGAGCQSYTQI